MLFIASQPSLRSHRRRQARRSFRTEAPPLTRNDHYRHLQLLSPPRSVLPPSFSSQPTWRCRPNHLLGRAVHRRRRASNGPIMRISARAEAEVWTIILKRASRKARRRILPRRERAVYPLHRRWVDLRKGLRRAQLLYRAMKPNQRGRKKVRNRHHVLCRGAAVLSYALADAHVRSSMELTFR